MNPDLPSAGTGSGLVRSLAEGRAGIYDPLAMNLEPKALVLGCCFVQTVHDRDAQADLWHRLRDDQIQTCFV